jgi:hypothetical protein
MERKPSCKIFAQLNSSEQSDGLKRTNVQKVNLNISAKIFNYLLDTKMILKVLREGP